MDMNQKAKSNVLQKLIDMMDEKMLGDLKHKSPKFAKPEAIAEPEMEMEEAEIADKDDKFPPREEELAKAAPEEAPESADDDEDMQRLIEMYKNLK
jgi:hypothetical protein